MSQTSTVASGGVADVTPYDVAWGPLLEAVAAAARRAPQTLVYLHLPKTGGTTVARTLEASSSWSLVRLPLSLVGRQGCSCGQQPCVEDTFRAEALALQTADSPARPLFIKFSHESFAAVEWLVEGLRSRGATLPTTVMAVRPARARLVSAFRDYWTQVGLAEAALDGTATMSAHRIRVTNQYLADSAHYRREDGSINGPVWFSAFAQYGPGVPFSLAEVFVSPERLDRALTHGHLVATPTADLSATMGALTGLPFDQRHRVSRPTATEAVTDALQASQDVIDAIALRDAEFDAVLARHLGGAWQ